MIQHDRVDQQRSAVTATCAPNGSETISRSAGHAGSPTGP
jgi:hypothetical protein